MRAEARTYTRTFDSTLLTMVLTALFGVASYFFGQPASIELHWIWVAFGSWCILVLTLDQFLRARRFQALEDQLRAIVDAVPHGLFFKDSDFRYRILNAEFGRMFGIDVAAALGQGDAELFGDALRERFAAQDQALIAAGEARSHDESMPVGGRLREIQSRKRPVYDRRGRLRGIVGVAIDVSEQKSLLRQLEDAHERLRIALGMAQLGTWEWNLQTNALHADARALQILGLGPGVHDVEAVFACIHADDRAVMRQRLQTQLDGKEAQGYEFRVVDASGAVRWVEGYFSAVRHCAGHEEVIGINRDITARRRVQAEQGAAKLQAERSNAELEQLQHDLALALGIGGLGIWRSVTPAMSGVRPSYEAFRETVLSSDRKIREIFGHEPHRPMTYRDQVRLMHPEDRERVMANFRSTYERGAGAYADQYRICRDDGAIRTVEVRGVLRTIREPGSGAPAISFTGFGKDVTEEEQLKAELVTTAQQARQAGEAKSRFLATMSHEVRTPLTGILGMIELVLDTPLSEAQRSMLARSRESSTALLAIINDILDFSKISAGMLEVERRPVSLRGLVEDVCASLSPEAAKKGIGLDFSVDAALPTYVAGDPVRLRQVLLNLVGNAVKFTEHGGVRVAAERAPGGRLRLVVEDTGIGIDPQAIEALFEPFQQAEVATTRRYGGTGLGLTIVRQLVDLMAGRVECESRPGQGTRFSVSLPLQAWAPAPGTPQESGPGRADRPAADEEKQPEQPGRGRRLLLAEDHRINREVITLQLARLGFECDCAEDGEQAWEMLQAPGADYDLLLTDCHMPRLDGYRLTDRVRGREAALGLPRLPIVALSANAMEGEAQRCIELGMDAYLCKPLRAETLGRELAAVLQRQPAGAAADAGASARRPADVPYAELMGLCGNAADKVAGLVQVFVTTTAADIEAIDAAAREQNRDRVRQLAHRMSSACQQLGEHDAVAALRTLEQRLQAAGEAPEPALGELLAPARHAVSAALVRARRFVALHGAGA